MDSLSNDRGMPTALGRTADAITQTASTPFRSFHNQAAQIYAYLRSLRFFMRQPRLSIPILGKVSQTVRGLDYGLRYCNVSDPASSPMRKHKPQASANPLRNFFEARETGRGIWKWDHYFDIYHHHMRKFVGIDVNILEIGIYSGGSLEMWRSYFGPKCHVYGIDIQEACRSYTNDYTDVFIGDQEDHNFWKHFRRRVPHIDIVIDDGGHSSQQQIVTLEELLPHLRPGGVYLCEDIHGISKGFNSFAHGLVSNLNALMPTEPTPGSATGSAPTQFQKWIRSIHFYPYVIVLEKAQEPVREFASRRKGTEWQPFGMSGAVAPDLARPTP